MNRKNIIIIALVIVMLTFAMVGKVFAAGSFSASLTPNNSRVSKGSEVKVTFKISGINVEGGINAITATLDYDSDVLDLPKDNVEGVNNWSATYNADTYKLAIDRAEVVKEDQEVLTMTFKVKDSTSVTTTAVKLKSIAAANSTLSDEVKISDITTNISISSSSGGLNPSPTSTSSSSPSTSPSGSSSSNNNTNNTNNNTNQNNTASNRVTNNTASNTSGSNTTTTKNEAVPYTGAEGYVVPLMLIIAVLGIVSFINYKRIG